mgnify:CR=1 FL=1
MIFLSKNGKDEYINLLASSCNTTPTSDAEFDYEATYPVPIVLRGILKHKLIKKCIKDNRDFFYIDSGYIGNYKSKINPMGYKLFHRIVKNNLQHTKIIDRPSDRWSKLEYKIPTWKKNGSHILVVMPSDKPAKYYDIDIEKWREDTLNTIKKYTDRPIVVREKTTRQERINNSIYTDLDNAYALVTLQSIAATESILYGVPAFTLAPNAAESLCLNDLTKIENPYYPDSDVVYKWACHLAYGQFHNIELENGYAWSAINES